VFDMDGLLLDSEPGWERAGIELLRRRGFSLSEDDRVATIGRSLEDAIEIYVERLGLGDNVGVLIDELLQLAAVEYGWSKPLPGAAELVGALRGRIPMAVASNTRRWLVDIGLAASGLGSAFDLVVTSDDVPRPKPAPDVYLLACERLGVEPADAIAFEDSTSGVAAATTAGLFTVAVPLLAQIDVGRADLILPSLSAVRVELEVG
jgi:HAD superfamily hydrolase (TIGR01509 family)